jgi:hypothetical protein
MGMSIRRLHLLPLPHLVPHLLNALAGTRQFNALAGTHLLNEQVEQHQHNTATRVPLLNATVGTNLPNVQAMGTHKHNVLAEALRQRQQQGERAPHPRIAQVATGHSGKGRLDISSVRVMLLVPLPSKEEVMPQQHGPPIVVVVQGQRQRAPAGRDIIPVAHSEEGVLVLLPIDRRSDEPPSSRRSQRDPSQYHHRLW